MKQSHVVIRDVLTMESGAIAVVTNSMAGEVLAVPSRCVTTPRGCGCHSRMLITATRPMAGARLAEPVADPRIGSIARTPSTRCS